MTSRINTTSAYFWQGQQVRLRPVESKDWQLIYAEEQDSAGIRVFEPGIRVPRSPEAVQEWIKREIEHNHQAQPGNWTFTVETLDSQLVGFGNLHSYNPLYGTFSFAIRIYRPFRGNGYAKDAVQIILRYGFLELRCQKANSVTVACNEASIRMHESLGFKQEGRLRRNVFTNGVYDDEVLFGMTREEFDEMEQGRMVIPDER